jgi:hypothetical protein
MPISATLFTAASAGALFKKNVDGALDPEANDDRSFRLIHNASQNRVDKYATIGACLGLADGAILGRAALRSTVASGLTGLALGVAAFGVQTVLQTRRDTA